LAIWSSGGELLSQSVRSGSIGKTAKGETLEEVILWCCEDVQVEKAKKARMNVGKKEKRKVRKEEGEAHTRRCVEVR
jgi:hypothetical protein